MESTKLESFNIIGISVRTTNENNKAAKDIGKLWNKFMTEGILDKIPNKLDSTIYSVYTEYESDHTKPYTTILGCKVSSLNTVPEGMVSTTISESSYMKFNTKGDLTEGLVYNEWLKIWEEDLNRTYTTDFEVYGKKAQNPANAEVDIFIAIK